MGIRQNPPVIISSQMEAEAVGRPRRHMSKRAHEQTQTHALAILAFLLKLLAKHRRVLILACWT